MKADRNKAEVGVSLPDLWFRAPTKNRVESLKPSELEGRGRPQDKGEGWDNG